MSFLPIFLLCVLSIQPFLIESCLETERDALLEFKAGVNDPSNLLASWRGQDCCTWAGIKCTNKTGHVVTLNLGNHFASDNIPLSGEISPSLLALSGLEYLDLSTNFIGNKFPKFVCSFRHLEHLDLSTMDLVGEIPPQIGNLSKLQYLDLSNYNTVPNIYHVDVWSFSHLSSLRYLYISGVNLQDSREWAQALSMLPSLESLILSMNNITTIPSVLSIRNFSSLTALYISENHFNTVIPDWIGKLTSLVDLEFSNCSFNGPIPNIFGNLSSLITLDLSYNRNLEGPVPSLHNLHELTTLHLEETYINTDINEVVSQMSNDTLRNLQNLFLSNTSLTGNLNECLHKMPNLFVLYVDMNKLNGSIPTKIGDLRNLSQLYLSNNYFTGEISEIHLSSLSNLYSLSLSSNFITIRMRSNWVPPFQLHILGLGSCKLGPKFPSWIGNQTQLIVLDLSNTGIVDNLPNWFWNFSQFFTIDLSYNQIRAKLPSSLEHLTILHTMRMSNNQFNGTIPYLPNSLRNLDLAYNSLSGPLPPKFEAPSLFILILSNNFLNGTIGQYTCGLTSLQILDLSGNNFHGDLPHCWPNTLQVVNMANNKFTGNIPSSVSSLNMLSVLQLNNNSLTGELPSYFQYCMNLSIIDLGENRFYGNIPEWLGETLPNLSVLRLRSNLFHGNIPSQLTRLTNLQVLDLGHNNLSGVIPKDLDKLVAMTLLDQNPVKSSSYMDFLKSNSDYYNISMIVYMKGRELEYSTTLSLLRSIDLSENNFEGEIPEKITTLHGLKNLNLSNNYLNGKIPMEIGKMQSLESLDLHLNELSGLIPQTLANLNFFFFFF